MPVGTARMRLVDGVRLGITSLLVLWVVLVAAARFTAYASRDLVGVDYRLMAELGHRWLEAGTMYLPYQFAPFAFNVGAGTTDVSVMPALYPPLAGPLFALLTALPLVWWGVPIAAAGYALWRLRPPLLLVLAPFCLPLTIDPFITGNPTMWMFAGVALGTLWGWPALVVLLKPTFLPFALVALRNWRASAIALAILAVVSLPMAGEWIRYVDVLRNMQSPGIAYSLMGYPLLLMPVAAWGLCHWRETREPDLQAASTGIGW